MTTDIDVPTGIRDPADPSHWLVPPWPADASVSEIVRHFLRFEAHRSASPTDKLAYYEGYAVALIAAPTHELNSTIAQSWYDELSRWVKECVRIYGELAVMEPDLDQVARPTASTS